MSSHARDDALELLIANSLSKYYVFPSGQLVVDDVLEQHCELPEPRRTSDRSQFDIADGDFTPTGAVHSLECNASVITVRDLNFADQLPNAARNAAAASSRPA